MERFVKIKDWKVRPQDWLPCGTMDPLKNRVAKVRHCKSIVEFWQIVDVGKCDLKGYAISKEDFDFLEITEKEFQEIWIPKNKALNRMEDAKEQVERNKVVGFMNFHSKKNIRPEGA